MRSGSVLALAVLVAASAALAAAPTAEAQYFGRNKVRYDDFDFKVLETEHFDLYYYEGLEQASQDVGRMAERWYRRLSTILNHEFEERKPIILYADDADFRQTNIANIGEGTQGVTEGLRQRVVLPMASTYAETDHVLGHELVHQFQYDIAQTSGSFQQFVRMPLFLIEGMAEYFSVGREDALTSMWMRDAVLRDDFPSLAQLQRSGGRYNEYQYGQPFWAYVGGTYGDEAAVRLFKTALQMPIDSAVVTVTGMHPDSLSRDWEAALRTGLVPAAAGRSVPSPERTERERESIAEERAGRAEARLEGKTPKPPRFLAYPDSLPRLTAQRLLARELDTGGINIAPQLSPDGRYVAYLSERDLFGIDLFLADATTGEVLSKLESVGTNPHFDALRFIASAGAWRPDGEQFAYVVFAGGDNEIAVLDVASRTVVRRLDVRSLGAIKDPTWSPDGRRIAFTGVKGGVADLYVVDVAQGTVRQLTNDRFADLQAAWSPDGRTLAFATDRGPGTDFDRLIFSQMRLALYDLETGEIEVLSLFPGRKHINPAWSPDGSSLYFISDRAGFNDVYRLAMDSREVYQVTNLATGVSGIADLSPALSVAEQTGALAYSVFEGQRYSVYTTAAEDAVGTLVKPLTAAEATADVLPPADALTRSRVTGYLADAGDGLPPVVTQFTERDYRSRLSLDYISQPTIGVGVDPYYGSGVGASGGVQMYFSDQLSDNVLGVTLSANGTFKDVGGQALYLNRSKRLTYGALVGQIPYVQSFFGALPEESGLSDRGTRYYYRTYISQARGLAAYPLNQSQRIEFEGGYTRYGYDLEFDSFVLDRDTDSIVYEGREPVRDSTGAPLDFQALNLGTGGAAFVGDHSFFGLASPIRGGRYRFGVDGTTGSLNYATVTADYRKYVFTRPGLPNNTPVVFAARALHYGRYGEDASSGRLNPLFLGYGSLVRGYGSGSFTNDVAYGSFQDRLFGSKVGVASVEARIPLLGVPQFGLISFPYLPTELTFFADAGMAWGGTRRVSIVNLEQEEVDQVVLGTPFKDARPILSAGISARINVLGALIVEPYYAFPFSRYGNPEDVASGRGVFGFNFTPGW